VTTTIIALEKDLFFSVKIRDTLRHYDMNTTIARTLAAFEQEISARDSNIPGLAIINIATKGVDWEAAIKAACAQNMPVLAFGSHMDLDARAKALHAGAQKVVANSKFARDMPGLVQRMLDAPDSDTNSEDDDEE
jgi:DNA-binding NtrC family response regulator